MSAQSISMFSNTARRAIRGAQRLECRQFYWQTICRRLQWMRIRWATSVLPECRTTNAVDSKSCRIKFDIRVSREKSVEHDANSRPFDDCVGNKW